MNKEEYLKVRDRICQTYNRDLQLELCKECPLEGLWCDWYDVSNAYETMAILDKWAADHPIKTNRDKFREVFGVELKRNEPTRMPLCEQYKIEPIDCLKRTGSICSYCPWLDEKYIEPKGEE